LFSKTTKLANHAVHTEKIRVAHTLNPKLSEDGKALVINIKVTVSVTEKSSFSRPSSPLQRRQLRASRRNRKHHQKTQVVTPSDTD
jgi:hypothetical protein